MYHEAKRWFEKSYYDTIEEMPDKAKVYFPDEKEPRLMTAAEICALDKEGWYTIMHSVNWGCCDHWTSEKPSKWVRERFNRYYHYTKNGKSDGEHVGYNRIEWSLRLTKQSDYWKSEVWNS